MLLMYLPHRGLSTVYTIVTNYQDWREICASNLFTSQSIVYSGYNCNKLSCEHYNITVRVHSHRSDLLWIFPQNKVCTQKSAPIGSWILCDKPTAKWVRMFACGFYSANPLRVFRSDPCDRYLKGM